MNVFVVYFKTEPLSIIFLEEMRKIRVNLSQDRQYPRRESNQSAPEYKTGVAKRSIAMVCKTESSLS
jgi:hypothetical protein